MPKSSKKWIYIILGGLVCANVIAFSVLLSLAKEKYLEITFFDVGQGDSIFIQAPKGQQILIDGGPTSAVISKLGKEMPFYDRSLDLVILSHPEKDHLAGLLDVLERYKVDNVLWTGVVRDTAEWKEWNNLIKKEGANIQIAQAGERIIISDNPFVYIDVLFPFEDLSNKTFEDSNDTSIVARLVFEKDSFLFTGDISRKTELELIKNSDLKSEVLKVAHHGSKYSSSLEFLKEVLPKIAVIEVGKDNTYGHPTPEVLARLKDFGIEVLRTDADGDIKIKK